MSRANVDHQPLDADEVPPLAVSHALIARDAAAARAWLARIGRLDFAEELGIGEVQ